MALRTESALLVLALLLALAGAASAFTPPLPLAASRLSSLCPAASLRPAAALRGPQPRVVGRARAGLLASSMRAAEGKVVEGVAVVLLAGGVGSRMKAGKPKQFLELEGKPMLMHSLELFLRLEGITGVTIVIAEEYRDMFAPNPKINFAAPGKERQDSVFNGLQQTPSDASLVCIHDAARPLVTEEEVYNVIRDAEEHGAAVLAVPMKATVKESEDGKFVLKTIERSRLWEIHTPQVIRPELLRKGFEKVQAENLAVTDDVSIIEQLPAPVKITVGEYTNIKVTTPEDMPMATSILQGRK